LGSFGKMDIRNGKIWKVISGIELAVATITILLDLWMPTIVILGIIVISLLIRKQRISSMGLRRPDHFLKMVSVVFLLAVAWTVVQFSITVPLLNHLTGATQNLSSFENLKGNFGDLFFLLFLTWTLAAFGEELVYRGYLQRRSFDLFGKGELGKIFAVGISSVLFGLAHSEQGIIGIVITSIDAVFFSAVKLHYKGNLGASILAHGFNNTIGIITFFMVGPLYGLW
jgi:uncharacterized protein